MVDRDTEVEYGRTYREVQSATRGIRVPQAPFRGRPYLERDGLGVRAVAPGLGVVDRRRGDRGRNTGFQGRGVESRGVHYALLSGLASDRLCCPPSLRLQGQRREGPMVPHRGPYGPDATLGAGSPKSRAGPTDRRSRRFGSAADNRPRAVGGRTWISTCSTAAAPPSVSLRFAAQEFTDRTPHRLVIWQAYRIASRAEKSGCRDIPGPSTSGLLPPETSDARPALADQGRTAHYRIRVNPERPCEAVPSAPATARCRVSPF